MPELIDRRQADEALDQALAQPTLAARLLTAAADHLGADAPTGPLTGLGWSRALCAATITTMRDVPAAAANYAAARAVLALPDTAPSITRGEYALRLRAAALGL
ncbi:hypothetical protein ABZ369_22400 [Streptomyces sp. NPDC005918]|uniref:hypothetical protein n=1 Tax=Streptomyces sp. NPDC005918 TaxID=3155454 RepID=UPI0033C03D4A